VLLRAKGKSGDESPHSKIKSGDEAPHSKDKLMGKTTGFMEYPRALAGRPSPAERVSDWQEFHGQQPERSRVNRQLVAWIVVCRSVIRADL
jgi:hypothetical protein